MATESGNGMVIVQSGLIYVAFAITMVILFTDKNLQTNFGLVSSGYFLHWYGLLVTAIVDVVGASILIVKRTGFLSKVGVVGSGLLALFLVLDILTYNMVGGGYFTSPSQFATYLFGFSKYQGTLNYIPGLFTGLFIVYLIAVVVGVVTIRNSGK